MRVVVVFFYYSFTLYTLPAGVAIRLFKHDWCLDYIVQNAYACNGSLFGSSLGMTEFDAVAPKTKGITPSRTVAYFRAFVGSRRVWSIPYLIEHLEQNTDVSTRSCSAFCMETTCYFLSHSGLIAYHLLGSYIHTTQTDPPTTLNIRHYIANCSTNQNSVLDYQVDHTHDPNPAHTKQGCNNPT